MRAGLALALVLVIGCKGSSSSKSQPTGAGSGSAPAPVVVDWAACETAISKAETAPLHQRPGILIDGCQVCGEWTPILSWNKTHQNGGPTSTDIEAAMTRCSAFCTGDAKLKFMGTLDEARGTNSRTPWRQLAQICKDKVSAVPDQRFAGGPYFALDRIARAVGAHGGPAASRLATIDLPLPALTLVGTGPSLPAADDAVAANTSSLLVSVLGSDAFVTQTPRAHLGAAGVAVDLGPDGYPGKRVPVGELRATLDKLGGDDRGRSIALLAAPAGRAADLLPVIAAAAMAAPVYLVANAHGPESWDVPGTIPVALDTKDPTVKITVEMTVQQLATVLAGEAAKGVHRVGVIAQ